MVWSYVLGSVTVPLNGDCAKTTLTLEILVVALPRIIVMVVANLLVAAAVYISAGRAGQFNHGRMAPEVLSGREIWHKNGCANCHAVYGLGGHLGPDLTNVISRRGEDFTRATIIGGGVRMPAQKLSDAQLDQIVSYLTHLDETGVYPTKSFPDGSFGKFPK